MENPEGAAVVTGRHLDPKKLLEWTRRCMGVSPLTSLLVTMKYCHHERNQMKNALCAKLKLSPTFHF